MVRTQIYLETAQMTRLDALASQRGVTRSDLVRDAVDAFLSTNGRASAARVEAVAAAVFGAWADDEGVVEMARARAELDREVKPCARRRARKGVR